MILHAGLIARREGGRWRGILIEGDSGSGKSELALRSLDAGFRLVADDRVIAWSSGGLAFGRAPEPLVGMIEARGQGILRERALGLAQIVLVAACHGQPETLERMPDPDFATIAGVTLPRLAVAASSPSAPARLRRAIEHLGAAGLKAYQACPLGGRDRAGTGDSP